MAIAWFICPYDTSLDANGHIERYCAAGRYIPVYPDKNGSIWTNVQFKSDYNIVKVSAPQTIIDKMTADKDLYNITNGYDGSTITFLKSLGYTDKQISGTEIPPGQTKPATIASALTSSSSVGFLDVTIQDTASAIEKV